MRALSGCSGMAQVVVCSSLAALTCASTSSATVLTFDMGVNNGNWVQQDYGDRVGVPQPQPPYFNYGSAYGPTPNVITQYNNLFFSNDPLYRYGDLEGVLVRHPDNTDNRIIILLAADPGYLVCLQSFDLAAQVTFLYNPPQEEDLPVKFIRVEDGPANVLYQKNYTYVNPDPLVIIPGTLPLRHNHYDFTANPIMAQQIRIVIDLNQIYGKVTRFGIDNIAFCQMSGIPSPGSIALLAGSLFMIGLRGRRR